MAIVKKGTKMKQLILVFLVMAAAGAVVTGQNPTATPGTQFNPFGGLNHDYPTPRPTVSKKALSQVPSQTQDAKTNRNSSTVTSTPSPQPNNRTMPFGNSPPVASGGILFGNGASWFAKAIKSSSLMAAGVTSCRDLRGNRHQRP